MKKHRIFPLALATCLALASCSTQEVPPVASTPTPDTQPTVVTPEPVVEDSPPVSEYVLETRDYSPNDEGLALEGIDFSEKITLVEYTGTDTHLVIPEGVQVIGESALRLGNFESITFPSTLEIIGWEALFNNDKLTSVTLPEGLLLIDGSAFQYCFALDSITLPQSLRGMTTGSLAGTGLSSVRLPENMDYLSVGIFYECEQLEVVEVKAESQTASMMTPVSLLITPDHMIEPTYYE